MRVITGDLGAGQTTMVRSIAGALPPGYTRAWLKQEYGALLCTCELASEVTVALTRGLPPPGRLGAPEGGGRSGLEGQRVAALWRRSSQPGVAPAYGARAGGGTRGAGSDTSSDAESLHVLPAAGREGWLCPRLRVGASQLGWPGGAKRTGPRAKSCPATPPCRLGLQGPRAARALARRWRATQAAL